MSYGLPPLGETIFWVRPHDERMHWYVGGNPRTSKTNDTRAYFFFSEKSIKALEISLLSFKEAFSGKNVKKIIGTKIEGFDMKRLGFVPANKTDEQRLKVLLDTHSIEKPNARIKASMNINSDYRFIAKLALGISHALFKNAVDKPNYLKELHKALWHRNEEAIPKMRGMSSKFQQNTDLEKYLGIPNATTLSIISYPEGVVLHLNINQNRSWSVLCCESSVLTESQLIEYADGRSYVIFKVIQECIQLSIPDLIAHNLGKSLHKQLKEIQEKMHKSSSYFTNL